MSAASTPPRPGEPGHRDRTYAAYFARISEGLLSSGDEPVTFERVVRRAVQIVPGCDEGAITVARRRRDAVPAAATAPELELLEQLLDDGGGPSWSGTDSGMLLSDDLRHERRWPGWAAAAVDQGFRSVLAIRLQTEAEDIGALRLYSRRSRAFTDDALDVAEIYATHAATALNQAHLVTGLRTALESRHEIGVAQGILAMRYEISHEQAFELLRRYSSRTNTKLRDVARIVVTTRALPEDDTAPG
ncbi:GAF and ANTAR domain-containing protein [Nocardioides salarius]|uniref:GAF and ANTAR domain-containing protein n=1 Tax=Nocardioides salarius TaxID=374513 RepID=UPI0030F4DE39